MLPADFTESRITMDLYNESDEFSSTVIENGSALKSITEARDTAESNGANELSMDHHIKVEDNDDDLYNSVIAQHSSSPQNGSGSNDVSGLGGGGDSMAHITGSGTDKRKFSCYIGNLTWWTTDKDLVDVIVGAGIADLIDVKFYENRQNGQSKGYALVSFDSEPSVRVCMERITNKKAHGQPMVVLPYTKHSLAQFEAATKKPGERTNSTSSGQMNALKSNIPEPGKPGGPVFIGTFRIGMAAPKQEPIQMPPAGLPAPGTHHAGPPLILRAQMPMGASQQFLAPPPGTRIMLPPSTINRPPPMMVQHHAIPPQLVRVVNGPPPGALPTTAMPPPGSHVNPNFYPSLAAASGASNATALAPAHHHHSSSGGGGMPPQSEAALSEAEFEEIMNRNRTVSSSAISRAVSDASAGDFASAIETLVTAISLIRQSKVAHDDRCKILISSLQDTLRGIEAKSFGGASSSGGGSAGGAGGGHRVSSKDRSGRSRSRERSKRRRERSRSRSRSRGDRFDDYSPRRRRY